MYVFNMQESEVDSLSPKVESKGILVWLDLIKALFKQKKTIFIAIAVFYFAIFIVLLAVYSSRPPLIIVTDYSFMMLYGADRLESLDKKLSWKYFRKTIPVIVDENAGGENIAIAVKEASDSPLAVMFPARYIEGARRYVSLNPGIPVWVMGTINQDLSSDSEITFFFPDTSLDLYRAGLCAGLLAGEDRVVVISESVLSDEYRDAFMEGLNNQGHLDAPQWTNRYYIYNTLDAPGCVVIIGPAHNFLEQLPSIPIILFSWAEPEFTPSSVKLLFDDSPMAMLPEAMKTLSGTGEIYYLGSIPLVFKDRIESRKDYSRLKGLVKDLFQNE